MDRLEVVRRRLHAQRLATGQFATPADAVAWLGAIQAQEYAEAKWSIGQRVHGSTDADVEDGFARGDILRTHLLRPTWHFVARSDIGWMLELTAPRVHAANRYMYRKLELDEQLFERTDRVLYEALASGVPLTRPELAEVLATAGIEADGHRLGYTVMHAELEALICSGPRRGRQHTYALLDTRAPEAEEMCREQALAELTRRFFRSRGPATVKDFTTWSSLTVADAKAGLERVGAELECEVDRQGRAWYAAPAPGGALPGTGAFLVPTYDELVIGYKDLKVVLAQAPPREGLLVRPIVIDGLTVGSWKRKLTSTTALIEATLFKRLKRSETQALEAAVERFGRFNGLGAELRSEVVAQRRL